ncbi:SPOR domain-containing protein [bacterium]|nr:SPOR domain-containing protein [bacterium]
MPRVEQVQQKALDEFRQKNINSGKRKQQQKKEQLNEAIIMFVCLFFLFSVVFLQLVKNFTPKIDTSIGNNTTDETQDVSNEKMQIDDRLKLIQFNDSMGGAELQKEKENSIFNSSLDEPVILPTRKKQITENEENSNEEKSIDDKISNIISKNKPAENTENVNVPNTENKQQIASVPALNPAPIPTSYKVYVGLYKTAEEAQTAKSLIRESSLGQNAFVKLTKEGYTLQIGSYSSKIQAETMVQALRVNNFPLARYTEEK